MDKTKQKKQLYLSSITHVAVQFVDIMGTLKERFYSNNFHFFFNFQQFINHLAPVRASLPDWSLPCRSLECRIRSQLHGTSHLAAHTVKRHRKCGMQIKQWDQSIVKGLCRLCHIISETTHLAVPAAQPVAAHCIVGKSTLLTAVGSTACTLLPFTEEWL